MSSIPPKPQTYQTLDAWRGLASLWVVMYHMTLVLIVDYPQLHTVPLYLFSLRGALGVQMFFVISGYCIANAACKSLMRGQGFSPFMQARVRRIYPPCWFALAFAAALSAVAAMLVASHHLRSSVMAEHGAMHQSVMYYFANLTLTQGILHQPSLIAPTWTLGYEMAFYLIVGLLIVPALFFKERFPFLPALHLITCSLLLLLILVPQRMNYPFDLWPEFGLGILAFDVLTHPNNRGPKVWLAGAGLLFLVFALTRNYDIGLMGESSRLTFLFCLLFTVVIIGLYKYESRLRQSVPIKLLSAIGLFSYSLYLTHVFSIGVINQALKVMHLPARDHYLIFILFMALAMGFARLFFNFFERPFMGTPRKPITMPLPRASTALAESK